MTVTALAPCASRLRPRQVEDAGTPTPTDDFRYTTLDGSAVHLQFKTTGLSTGTYVLVFRVAGDPLTHGVQFQIK